MAKTKEKTGAQVLAVAAYDGTLNRTISTSTYATYRKMRLDPTIALARWLSVAPILASNWSVETKEGAPNEARDFISEQLLPLRTHIVKTGMYGTIDFGWQAYEKVFKVLPDGKVGIDKIKPLIQDYTDILVDKKTGAFAGLLQSSALSESIEEARLNVAESLLLSIDVEGTDWYGQPIMEVARSAYDKWNDVDDAATRYDSKMAGSHWVIEYPIGQTPYGAGNVLTDNYIIAQSLINSLQASGAIAIPREISEVVMDRSITEAENAWKITLVTDSANAQSSFIERERYLDALKVRAFGLPERAVLEGQYGTKADAEAHAAFAITNMELRNEIFVQSINWHLVNQLLRINFGPKTENLVYLRPSPITDLAKIFLQEVYKKILEDESGFALEASAIDAEALRDRLDIPQLPDDDIDAKGVNNDTENLPIGVLHGS